MDLTKPAYFEVFKFIKATHFFDEKVFNPIVFLWFVSCHRSAKLYRPWAGEFV